MPTQEANHKLYDQRSQLCAWAESYVREDYPLVVYDAKTRSQHRYRVGDDVQTKDGHQWCVAEVVWQTFRWFPLEPAYVLKEVGKNTPLRILHDGNLW